MKSNFYLIIVAFLMSWPFSFKAQNLLYKDATVSRPAEFWKPFMLKNGTNIENGVSFYITKTDCNSQKTKLLKVINSNPYPVIFSYQLSSNHPVENVSIGAAISLEGTCETTDKNLAKLSLILPPKKENPEDKNEIMQFILSHITVTKFE